MVEVSEFVHPHQHRFGSIHYTSLAAKVNAPGLVPDLGRNLSRLCEKDFLIRPM